MADAQRPTESWKPDNPEFLLNHDAVTIPVSDLPLEAIAEFCRKWGIKEMYSVPMDLEWFEPGGPFDGTQVSMRVVYRDDAPYTTARWGLGQLLGDVIGKKAYVTDVPSPDTHPLFDGRHESILKRKVPVYVE